MTLLAVVPDDTADPEVARMYAADRERVGYLPNYTRAFSTNPQLYAAWRALVGAVTSALDARLYELATLGAARTLRSSYCSLAHGQVLLTRFVDHAELLALLAVVDAANAAATGVGPQTASVGAGVDPRDAAVVTFAARVARNAADIDEADIAALRAVGLTDEEVFGIVAAAAARCFFSTVLDATGTQPDSAYAALDPPLASALSIGRPIAGGSVEASVSGRPGPARSG
ncbi:MAG: carboxymuconolactone decarboxylase family protein [Dermatophilaceae bacterium]